MSVNVPIPWDSADSTGKGTLRENALDTKQSGEEIVLFCLHLPIFLQKKNEIKSATALE